MKREKIESNYTQTGLTNYAGKRIEYYTNRLKGKKNVAIWLNRYIKTNDDFVTVVRNRESYNWRYFDAE